MGYCSGDFVGWVERNREAHQSLQVRGGASLALDPPYKR